MVLSLPYPSLGKHVCQNCIYHFPFQIHATVLPFDNLQTRESRRAHSHHWFVGILGHPQDPCSLPPSLADWLDFPFTVSYLVLSWVFFHFATSCLFCILHNTY